MLILRLGLLAFVLSWVGRAVAQTPPVPTGDTRRVVEVVASSSVELEELVRELLRPLPVVLRWSQVARVDARDVLAHRANDPLLVARVWLDLADEQHAYLYVANAAERFIVRAVPLQNGYDEVARESLAHIVESIVDALLAGVELGVSREMAARQLADRLPSPATTATATSPPSRVPTRTLTTHLVAYYRVGAWSADNVVHAPGIALGFTFGRARRIEPVLFLWASAIVPFTWDGPKVGAEFAGLSARLTAGIAGRAGRRVVWRALVGPGFDAIAIRSRPHYPILAVRPFWVVAPIVTALASIDVRLGGPIAFQLAAGLEADVANTHYDLLLRDKTRETVLQPWPVRPFALLGLIASF